MNCIFSTIGGANISGTRSIRPIARFISFRTTPSRMHVATVLGSLAVVRNQAKPPAVAFGQLFHELVSAERFYQFPVVAA